MYYDIKDTLLSDKSSMGLFIKNQKFWYDNLLFNELKWYQLYEIQEFDDLTKMMKVVYYALNLEYDIPLHDLDYLDYGKLIDYSQVVLYNTVFGVNQIDSFIKKNYNEVHFLIKNHVEGYTKYWDNDMSFRAHITYIKALNLLSEENKKEAEKNKPVNQDKIIGKSKKNRDKFNKIRQKME